MPDPSILATEPSVGRHPAYAQLEYYAGVTGVSLDGLPEAVQNDNPADFLIFGPNADGVCVYWNERENEVGQCAPEFARAYAMTGRKPDSPQFLNKPYFLDTVADERTGRITTVRRDWTGA